MAKTMQVMTLEFDGRHYVCVKHMEDSHNPYKLYEKWWDSGWHRRKVVEYTDIDSVLFHLLQSKYPVVNWDVR